LRSVVNSLVALQEAVPHIGSAPTSARRAPRACSDELSSRTTTSGRHRIGGGGKLVAWRRTYTEASSYSCTDSKGSNAPFDACTDKYTSLDAYRLEPSLGTRALRERIVERHSSERLRHVELIERGRRRHTTPATADGFGHVAC